MLSIRCSIGEFDEHFKNMFHILIKYFITFFRALQICPAAKSLYLDAISYILSMDHGRRADSNWLAKTLEILVEKEGRWRLPLEELDVLMDKEEDLDDSSDDSD